MSSRSGRHWPSSTDTPCTRHSIGACDSGDGERPTVALHKPALGSANNLVRAEYGLGNIRRANG